MATETKKVIKLTIVPEVTELLADYHKIYGKESVASPEEVQMLWDDSEDGLSATDILAFEQERDAEDEPADDVPAAKLVSSSVREAVAIRTRDKGAIELAQKLVKSKDLLEHLSAWVENEAQRKRLPAAIALDFQATLTKDDILGAPEPGSRYDDEGIGNALYDVRKAGEGSWYADVADELPEGSNYVRMIGNIKAAISDSEITPKEYEGRSRPWLDGELATMVSRRNNLKGAVKTAMTLCKRVYRLSAETLLEARFRTEPVDSAKPEGKQAIVRSAVPIQVFYLEPMGDKHIMVDKHVGVGAFNRVDFSAIGKLTTAKEQLGAFAARRTRGAADKNDNNVSISNVAQLNSAVADLAAMGEDSRFLADLYQELSKEDATDFRVSLYRTALWLDRMLNKPSLRKLYAADIEKIETAKKAAADKAA